MANIVFNIKNFECEAPVLGDIYRTGSNYEFNYTSKGDLYEGYGLDTSLKLFYRLEEVQPEQEYTDQTMPYNANNFVVGPFNADIISFRLEFRVDNGDENTCYKNIYIPYSQIQNIN